MSDPKRMLEETDDEFERALLRSVQHDGMTTGSRRRLLAGLGIAGALVTTSSTAASSTAAGNAGLFKGLTGVVAKKAYRGSTMEKLTFSVFAARKGST